MLTMTNRLGGIAARLVLGAVVVVCIGVVAPASAQTTYVGVNPPQLQAFDAGGVLSASGGVQGASGGVQGASGGVQSLAGTRPGGQVQAPARAGGFALTGADILGLVVLAGACLAVGVITMRATRSDH